jgi:uncharacterized membrane protein HdeD (DUF308 family)
MVSVDNDTQTSPTLALAASWQATLFLGALTVILGLVVSFHPTGSLNVVAVLLGILMILSGIFHLIRTFDSKEMHRVWLGIAGLMFIVVGVVLIRHLVASAPASSLNVLAVLLGIWFVIMGIFEIIGALLLRHELRAAVLSLT